MSPSILTQWKFCLRVLFFRLPSKKIINHDIIFVGVALQSSAERLRSFSKRKLLMNSLMEGEWRSKCYRVFRLGNVHVPWAFEIPEKRVAKIRISPVLSYIYTLYRPHTPIHLYYNMSYSKGFDSDGSWKVSQLTMMKERGRMRRALTIAQTETPSQREMRTLVPNRGLLVRQFTIAVVPWSWEIWRRTLHRVHQGVAIIVRYGGEPCILSTRGVAISAQHHVFIFAVFIEEHQLICCIVMVVFNIYSVR